MNNSMKYTDEELIAYLAGDLDDRLSKSIEAWIGTSAEAQQRVAEFRLLDQVFSEAIVYQAPTGLLGSFRERLAGASGRSWQTTGWLQLAAGILLLIGGFGAGRVTMNSNQATDQLSELKDEVRTLQQVVMLNTLRNNSASERLQAIYRAEETPAIQSDELVRMLLGTMNNDASPNVRYAAVQALGRFMDQESVRVQILSSLDEQDNPLVQIAMISLLVEAGDRAAIAPLRKIINNENAVTEVRQHAQIALNLLI
jgi:hypothetical protein